MRINRPYIIDGYDKYFRIFNRVFWYLQRDTKSKIHIQSGRRVVDLVIPHNFLNEINMTRENRP